MALVVNAFQGQAFWARPQLIDELPKRLKTELDTLIGVNVISWIFALTPISSLLVHLSLFSVSRAALFRAVFTFSLRNF